MRIAAFIVILATVLAALGLQSLQRPVADKAIHGWWISRLSLADGTKTYIGYVRKEPPEQVVVVVDDNGQIIEKQTLGTTYSDDHNAPALAITADNKLIVAYTHHNTSRDIRFRKSSDKTLSGLGDEQLLPINGRTTYAQFIVDGATVYLFTRIGGKSWAVLVSTDHGATWGDAIPIVGDHGELLYMVARLAGDKVRAIVMSHALATDNVIRIFEIKLSTGVVTTGAAVLGALGGTPAGLPVPRIALASIKPHVAGRGYRLFDVNDDGTAYLYADFALPFNAADSKIYLARLTGRDASDPDHWTHTEIVNTGSTFWSEPGAYLGGANFAREPHSGLRVYTSREQSGTWYIERHDSALGDGSDFEPTIIEQSNSEKLFRPVSPLNATSGLPVYWVKGSFEHWIKGWDTVLTWGPEVVGH